MIFMRFTIQLWASRFDSLIRAALKKHRKGVHASSRALIEGALDRLQVSSRLASTIQALLHHEALIHYLPDTGNGSIHVPLGGKAPQAYAYCPCRCLLIKPDRTQYVGRRARR